MAQLRTYSFEEVDVVVYGQKIVGFADEDSVVIEPDDKHFKTFKGINGEQVRAFNQSLTGKIHLNLLGNHDSNHYLSTLAWRTRNSDPGELNVMIKDNNGTTLVIAPWCYISSFPTITLSKKVNTVKWTFEGELIVPFAGQTV